MCKTDHLLNLVLLVGDIMTTEKVTELTLISLLLVKSANADGTDSD